MTIAAAVQDVKLVATPLHTPAEFTFLAPRS